jgi:hypothetical protein
LIFASKKFKNPVRLFDPSVIVPLTRVRFGMCVNHRWIRRWRCRWIRRWLWHNTVNIFQLSVKYRQVLVRRYGRRWLWHNPVNFFQLPVKYRWVIVRRCRRRWNRQYFLFFCLSPSQNLELQTYSTHNTITREKSWQLKNNKYFMFQNITL